jgi:trehalose/maltose hydrolase-like predicted phosphorylase
MNSGWVLAYDGLDRQQEGLREALCTLGNGFFATRGAAEEQQANGTNYPGTYIAGGYNQLESEVAGRTVVNEDLVNFPNWLWLTFRIHDGDWLDLWKTPPLEYRQELNLREGLLLRRFRFADARGRITSIESRRLVHMEKPNLAALEWRLTPENWSGAVVLRSGLDGSITNGGVARYRQLSSKHLEICHRAPVSLEGVYLKVKTSQSRIEVGLAARTRLYAGEVQPPAERRILLDEPERIFEEMILELRQGSALRVEKVVALFTSRDRGISEAGLAARLAMEAAPNFETLRRGHRAAWDHLWRRCDIEVDAEKDPEAAVHDQLALRLHVFHLLQTASRNSVGRDVGIPSRGLHGEAYRGHVFWDELFILPFYTQRMPALARSVILYRYHRLDAARELARQAGFAGATFPWQSGSDGREATQELHLNPLSGRWDPDYSHLQRHVNSAIVYNIWRYFEATRDRAFLEAFGAEIVLEIARFWSSLAKWNPATGRYDIAGVMGPDEYHEKYPGAETGGLKNNAYTNVTAVWCLLRVGDILEAISSERRAELLQALGIDDAELARWEDISRRLTIAFHDGVISQFEGYAALEELDWPGYRQRYGRIERLDRILRAEGTSTDRFKVSKQGDVVMLLYLFSNEELIGILRRLGYAVDNETIRRSVQYYQARTSHGSTLSKVVFLSAVHREDPETGSRLFISALHSDIYDVQGGTTPEGVHLGAMAGSVDIVTRHYAGLELRRDGVHLSPELPLRMRRLRFRVLHHARWFNVELTQERLYITLDDAEPGGARVHVQGRPYVLSPGKRLEVRIEPRSSPEEERISVDEEGLAGGRGLQEASHVEEL